MSNQQEVVGGMFVLSCKIHIALQLMVMVMMSKIEYVTVLTPAARATHTNTAISTIIILGMREDVTQEHNSEKHTIKHNEDTAAAAVAAIMMSWGCGPRWR